EDWGRLALYCRQPIRFNSRRRAGHPLLRDRFPTNGTRVGRRHELLGVVLRRRPNPGGWLRGRNRAPLGFAPRQIAGPAQEPSRRLSREILLEEPAIGGQGCRGWRCTPRVGRGDQTGDSVLAVSDRRPPRAEWEFCILPR